MDVEFKLIGDLTMRQFAYLCTFGGLAYVVTITPTGIFKIPLFILLCGLGIGLAFIPIEERGLDVWIVSFIKAVYSPTQMIWKKEASLPSFFLHDNLDVVKQEMITLAPTSSRRQLEEYLRFQEGREVVVDPLDIPEQEYIEKIRRISATLPDYDMSLSPSATPSATPPAANVAVAVEEPEITEVVPSPEFQPLEEEPEEPLVTKPEPIIELPEAKKEEPLPIEIPVTVSPVPSPEHLEPQPPVLVQPEPSVIPPVQSQPEPEPISVPKPPARPQPVQKPVVVIVKPKPELGKIMREKRPERDIRFMSPMTPDMHSGRKFSRLLPNLHGTLQLPSRQDGSRLQLKPDINMEEDIRDKAAKLQQLLEQIKENELGQKPSSVKTSAALATAAQAGPAKIEDLERKLSALQNQLNTKQALIESMANVPAPERAVLPERRIPSMEELVTVPTPGNQSQAAPVKAAQMSQFLSIKPNVITGVLKDPSGKTLENVLMIIKNPKGDPVRAFKTNKLGQFITTTPLVNGKYTLEVSAMNELGLTFDIISIEANGQVIPSMEVIGRS